MHFWLVGKFYHQKTNIKNLPVDTPLLQTPRYYGQNPALHPAKAIEVWLKMTPSIADSRYYGLQTASRGCPL